MDMERGEDEPDPNGSGRNPASKHRFDMKTPMLWIPNLGDLCDLLCKNFPAIGREGSAQKGAKITKVWWSWKAKPPSEHPVQV